MVQKVQGWGSKGARVQPIQVAAASDRRRARQRDTGFRSRGLGVLGCIRFWLLAPVTGVVRSSVTRSKGDTGSEKLGKWSRRCRVGGLRVLGCNRYRLLPPVTGDVRGSETRVLGVGVWGCWGASNSGLKALG